METKFKRWLIFSNLQIVVSKY